MNSVSLLVYVMCVRIYGRRSSLSHKVLCEKTLSSSVVTYGQPARVITLSLVSVTPTSPYSFHRSVNHVDGDGDLVVDDLL